MKRFGFLFALIAAPGILLLQAAQAPQQQTAQEETCTVGGQVVHISSGEALGRVNLVLQGGGRDRTFSVRSDSNGRFVFSNVPPGTYRLSGERVGFIREAYSAREAASSATTIRLTAGQTINDIVFKLTPQGVVTGMVLDEVGDPVQGANVQLLQHRYTDGARQLMPVSRANSNDIGEYRLAQVNPGRYYLVASYGGGMRFGNRARQQQSTTDSYMPTYYPGTPETSSAVPIEVAVGAQLQGFDIQLLKTRVVSIRGRVVNGRDNSPANNVAVAVSPNTSQSYGPVFANRRLASVRNDNGTFEISGVPPGSYILSVNSFGRGRGRGRTADGATIGGGFARLPVEVGESDVEGLVLVLQDPIELSGAVIMESDDEVQLRRIRLTLSLSEGGGMMRFGSGVEEDGSFNVPGLSPDNYQLDIAGIPEGAYLKSAQIGNDDILGGGIDLTAGVAPGPLRITISSKGAAINGSVVDQDQQPAGGITVTLVPESEKWTQTHLFKTASTDQNGAFQLSGIAPGDYQLFAWEQIESGAYRDPLFIKPFEGDGATVSVEESSTETVQLEMIPADAVEYR